MAVSLLRPEMVEVSLLSVVGTPERETTVAREILDTLAADLSDRGATVTTTVLEGEAANQITALAVENGYDLIVMSTHGHNMLTRALVGSVTDRVVRTSEVPVLVIQPQSMEAPYDPVSGEDVDQRRPATRANTTAESSPSPHSTTSSSSMARPKRTSAGVWPRHHSQTHVRRTDPPTDDGSADGTRGVARRPGPQR